jgi:hypothetical protein
VASSTVRIKGLRETIRAFNKLEASVALEIRNELKDLAEPVAETARQKISRYAGASVGTIGPRASVRGAFVTQRAKKVTGQRADFGALQMTRGMIPALEEHEDEIVSGVEKTLDRLTATAGF